MERTTATKTARQMRMKPAMTAATFPSGFFQRLMPRASVSSDPAPTQARTAKKRTFEFDCVRAKIGDRCVFIIVRVKNPTASANQGACRTPDKIEADEVENGHDRLKDEPRPLRRGRHRLKARHKTIRAEQEHGEQAKARNNA